MINPLSLFKAEKLDERLVPKEARPLPKAQSSKWNTPEFYIYYLFFLTIPPLMFKAVYDVSRADHPNIMGYAHLLSQGWIPGRPVDNSDLQYRGFRSNIPYLALLLVLHPILRRVYERFRGSGTSSNGSLEANGDLKRDDTVTAQQANTRLQGRIRFDIGFAVLLLLFLHGISTIKIFGILYINYLIPTRLPKQYVPAATWIFNVGIMFANELCRGYNFVDIFALVLPSTTTVDPKTSMQPAWGAWLDSYGGLMPRWEVLFNVTVLRMISFNFDYLWMLDRRASSPIEKKNLDPSALPEKERIKTGASPYDYTPSAYLAYALYSPLYLAGPILTFNDYISQCRYPLRSLTWSRIAPYAVRFGLCLLTMELCLHYLYVVAICKSNPPWRKFYTPFQLAMLGYFNLHIIWLKLLLPWRFFRLWALVDGIDPPENMVRCMSDNYSALAFWRGWHRSFNLWIVRYIYLPLGGSRVGRVRSIANFVAVFTFVALWHDINLKLLMWGWLVVLFVLPEILATLLFPAKQWEDRPNAYRWLCGIGAVANILMMMIANSVGFALGVDGTKGLMDAIIGSLGGRVFFLAACVTLFVGTQIMFEVREAEKRRGVNLKY